ncbi:glucosyltransferase [Aureococcus anophagefferens]|nr:glucosyltransferase [Aureococcus anophagefferens]
MAKLEDDAPQPSTFALPVDAPPRPSEAARRRFLEGLAHKGQRPLLFGELVVEKRGGELQMRERRGWCPGSAGRAASTFRCLREADAIYRWPDFGPLSISTGDAGADGSLAFCHETPGARTVPDFVFHRWPEAGVVDYAETCASIAAAGEKPAATDRGLDRRPRMRRLAEIGDSRQDLFSITLMTWRPGATGRHGASSFVSLPELVATYARSGSTATSSPGPTTSPCAGT